MPSAATWMRLKILTQSEVRKRKTNTIRCAYMQNLKYGTNEPTKQKQTQRQREQTWVVGAKGEGGEIVMNWEFGVKRCKLLHLEWKSNEVLLYSTGNYI